ncbi:MAG: hypothetical protein J6X01_02510 [Bacteroidales bacterium]|nr:hypothetical protein [Bacteroidales bacterium]
MKKINTYILLTALLLTVLSVFGQESQQKAYNRSSIYPLYVTHPGTAMFEEIFNALWELPVPDKFNDHCLSLRIVNAADAKEMGDFQNHITKFLAENQVAKRMVAKWFNRDKETGAFDIALISDRGFYNASQADLALAMQSARGKALLSDAGEQLIPNTFVVVSDVTYINKQEQADKAAAFFTMLGAVAGAASGIGGDAGAVAGLAKSMADLGGDISDMVAGFTVRVESHLFQLVWDEEIASIFYNQYYYDAQHPDEDKKSAFEQDEHTFKLRYIGSYKATSDKTVMRGVNSDEEVFRKVLARATDKNIVELQKQFDVFKVVMPVYKVQGDKILVQIGLKEGVSANSKYEVVERVEDANGNISYHRKGVIKPVTKQIWDNRYMAVEEEAENANLNYTTFEVVSGSGFYPGMLVREIKF